VSEPRTGGHPAPRAAGLRRAVTAALQRSAELSSEAARMRQESHTRRLASRAHLLYARLQGEVDRPLFALLSGPMDPSPPTKR
jgi:hypothetical protein